MSNIIVEKPNDAGPAGTIIKAGTNSDIDKAFAAGELSGVTVGADGSYLMGDGTALTSAGGTTTTVDLSNATAEDMANIAALADLTFLSQNTGVSGAAINAGRVALGIDASDFVLANKILTAAGYNPGEQADFYGNNTTNDVGAQLLVNKWNSAPTAEDLEAAGLDPNEVTVINSNAANAFWLENALAESGLDYSNTSAIQASTATYGGGDQGPLGMSGATSVNDMPAIRDIFGGQEDQLDMLEWDNLTKKKEEDEDIITGIGGTGGASGIGGSGIPGSGVGGAGGITGNVTNPADAVGIPAAVPMPEFATINTPQVTGGMSGTYTTPAETFGPNLTTQTDALKKREAETAKLYQPQTIQEKKDAGQDVSAYTLTQKLFRNPNTGHQIYIPHYGDQPQYPIPAGYVEVSVTGASPFTYTGGATPFNPLTAGGNTYTTGANQGGYMQGFNTGAVSSLPDSSFDSSQIYGNVSFQDPVTGQIVTQTPQEYYQSLQNRQAQATFSPATMVSMPGTSIMTEATSPGTVLESTAGQALGTAPMVTGDQIAQISNVSQAKGPGTPEIRDEQGNVISAAVGVPTSTDATVKAAAPALKTELMGGETFKPLELLAKAVEGKAFVGGMGPIWDAQKGKYVQGGMSGVPYREYTPSEFAQEYNLNLSDYMDVTGGFQPETLAALSDTVTGQTDYSTSVSDLDAASGTAKTVADVAGTAGVPKRVLDQTVGASELVSGTGVDQAKVQQAFGTGEAQAASVQGELATLMAQFDDGNTPAWAAGSMRKATAIMNQRGLGASSMAGQAIIQAAMEAALPIAQIDAGNKQQMALFKAEQRAKFLNIEFDQAFQAKVMNAAKVSEVANINFSAEQQIALENSRAANTMELANLNNEQALTMAEAAALSQLDMASLTNLQQAQVQNAQNFLQLDMANLANKQSTALFKSQAVTNAMLSDTAQSNANEQFNATSENQMTQFASNLSSQVSQFNAAQQNAINQFNTEEANALLEFNSALQNQREMFNAQNYLVVAQANAKWRQDITTANTAAQNISNLTYAKEVNGLTQKTLDDYWMKERDIMSYVFKKSENSMDRAVRILLGEQTLTAMREKLTFVDNKDKSAFWSRLLLGDASLTDLFKFNTPEETP